MKTREIAAGLAGLVLASAGVSVLAEASQPAEKLFESHGCINCHGAQGKAPVSKLVPELAGKPADELYSKATDILHGKNMTDEAKLMHAAIFSPANCNAPPSDETMKSITDWLASQ